IALIAIAGGLIAPGGAKSAPACTKTWNSSSSGDFSTAAKWTPSGVPAASDVACITNATSGVTVTLSANRTLAGIIVDSGETLSIPSGLQLTVNNSGAGNESSISHLSLAGTLTGTATVRVPSGGTWTLASGSVMKGAGTSEVLSGGTM